MRPTTLRLLVQDLDRIDDKLTVYAEGGPGAEADSRAVAALEPADGSTPASAAGFDYVLEVSIAKEVVDVWSH